MAPLYSILLQSKSRTLAFRQSISLLLIILLLFTGTYTRAENLSKKMLKSSVNGYTKSTYNGYRTMDILSSAKAPVNQSTFSILGERQWLHSAKLNSNSFFDATTGAYPVSSGIAATFNCTISAIVAEGTQVANNYAHFAQSFTACQGGVLSNIRFLNAADGSSYPQDLTLTIRQGNGLTGTILGTITVPRSSLTNATSTSDLVTVDVSSLNIPVVNSQSYTFGFEGATNNRAQLYYGRLIPSSNDFESFYAGGRMYFEGASFDNVDLIFEVEIEPAVLPVLFGNISARSKNGQLQVNWLTHSEINNNYFEVQASRDGANWHTIQTIKSQSSHGNSNEVLEYNLAIPIASVTISGLWLLGIAGFAARPGRRLLLMGAVVLIGMQIFSCSRQEIFKSIEDGKLYIRIIQIDKDGKEQTSKVIRVIAE